jgi:hypothetical protein
MKRVTLKRLGLLVGVLALALSGCGGSKNNGAAGPGGLGGGIGGQPSGQCFPITGVVGFVGNQIQLDNYNLRGGTIPYVGTIGQMGTAGASSGQFSSSGAFGTISLQAQQTAYGVGNIAGGVQASAQVIQYLQTVCQYGGQPFCPQPVQQVCVSNVAIDMGMYNGRLYGNFYLYLNGTQHGYTLTFSL